MTQKSSFFNSVGGDRKYQASDFAEYFNSLVTNGVFPSPSTNLQALADGNMTVTLKAGPAWIKGYHYQNDSDLILPITVADGVLKRIDRIVLKMDTIARNITAVVKKGAFASTPVAPTLQRDADAYELGIADIYIANGATGIVQANITDLRMNTTYCGWVNSLIQADTTAIFDQYQAWYAAKTAQYEGDMASLEAGYQADITNMEAQFQSDFTAWFETIQGQLSGDIAANLAGQIATLGGSGGIVEKANKSALDATNTTVAAHLADYVRQHAYANAGGTANAITVSTDPAPTTYTVGMGIKVKTASVNTSSVTINWNGLGAKSIRKNGLVVLSAGDLPTGEIVNLVYDGTYFQLQPVNAILKTLLTTAGDIIYASSDNTPARLAKGTDGQLLVLSGGLPTWGSAGTKLARGTYIGDGVASKQISVGFTPKIVRIYCNDTTTDLGSYYLIDSNSNGAYFYISSNCIRLEFQSYCPKIGSNGFITGILNPNVGYVSANKPGDIYYWEAFS